MDKITTLTRMHCAMLTIGICNCHNHSNSVRMQQPAYIKMREAKSSHTRFQVKDRVRLSRDVLYWWNLFIQNGDSATKALWEFWSFKWLWKALLTSRGLTNKIRKFKAMRTLVIQPGRGWKCIAAQIVDDAGRQVEEYRLQTISSTNIQRTAASVDQPRSTIDKILR